MKIQSLSYLGANYFVSKLDYQPGNLCPALVELVIVLMAVGFKSVEKIVEFLYVDLLLSDLVHLCWWLCLSLPSSWPFYEGIVIDLFFGEEGTLNLTDFLTV